jgi:hypothetical protein
MTLFTAALSWDEQELVPTDHRDSKLAVCDPVHLESRMLRPMTSPDWRIHDPGPRGHSAKLQRSFLEWHGSS